MFKPRLSVSLNCIAPLGLHDGAYRYEFSSSYEDKIIEMQEQGFYAVEIGAFANYAWEVEKHLVRACEIAQKHGIKVNSVHFPFGYDWVNLVSPWESDRLEIIKWIGKVCKRLEKFDIRAYVFHPSDMGRTNESNYRENMTKLCDTADKIADLTDAYVCVENMAVGYFMFGIRQSLDFIQGTKKAQMVVDVNHYLHENVAENLLLLGNRVKTLHISDCHLEKEEHLLPGEGKIDFMALLSALEKSGYDGVFNYEVSTRKYPFKEIKENYNRLFEEYNRYKNAKKIDR